MENIETAYMLELGSLEYKAYEAQCQFLRLKRKLELIQARINRQEKVIISEIDEILDEEFLEYKERLDEHLGKDERLNFFREPDNKYDKEAIVIKTKNGVKIGYVPRKDNVIFARLMDAGKLLFGRITGKENIDTWIKIYIKVFLQE